MTQKMYRLLNNGETVVEGDEYYNPGTQEWNKTRAINKIVGSEISNCNIYRREMQMNPLLNCESCKHTFKTNFQEPCVNCFAYNTHYESIGDL